MIRQVRPQVIPRYMPRPRKRPRIVIFITVVIAASTVITAVKRDFLETALLRVLAASREYSVVRNINKAINEAHAYKELVSIPKKGDVEVFSGHVKVSHWVDTLSDRGGPDFFVVDSYRLWRMQSSRGLRDHAFATDMTLNGERMIAIITMPSTRNALSVVLIEPTGFWKRLVSEPAFRSFSVDCGWPGFIWCCSTDPPITLLTPPGAGDPSVGDNELHLPVRTCCGDYMIRLHFNPSDRGPPAVSVERLES